MSSIDRFLDRNRKEKEDRMEKFKKNQETISQMYSQWKADDYVNIRQRRKGRNLSFSDCQQSKSASVFTPVAVHKSKKLDGN